uniref:(northern house mosquito) hypothetical protein n=1 Tax=Culex pipiens TaxID=7175 RepID=A0A8D8N7V7_CULPI
MSMSSSSATFLVRSSMSTSFLSPSPFLSASASASGSFRAMCPLKHAWILVAACVSSSSLGSNSASSSALVGSRSVSAEFCCCPASLPLTSPCFIVVPLRTWWPRNAAWILVAAAST